METTNKPLEKLNIFSFKGVQMRTFHLTWMALALDWAHARGIAVFDKQVGSAAVAGPSHRRVLTKDRKGGDMAEWPAALRVREFPSCAIRERT